MSRKRLGRVDPAAAAGVREAAEQAARTGAPKGAGLAPIAQVAQGVSREIDAEIHRLRAELNKVAEAASALQTAEEEGRLLKIIPLDEIDLGYIQRDRIHMGRAGEEWAALKASIAARGRRSPSHTFSHSGSSSSTTSHASRCSSSSGHAEDLIRPAHIALGSWDGRRVSHPRSPR